MPCCNVEDVMHVSIRAALWWLVVRWGGEVVLVYSPHSLSVGAWLFASMFLLYIIFSALSVTISLFTLLCFTLVWLFLSYFFTFAGVRMWWQYVDIGCIFGGWLTGYLAVKAWRRLQKVK